jgi:tetratricopeptide (TPR) repeat protein
MIQPLRPNRSHWALYWVDLHEPIPSGDDFILPTCMFVVGDSGKPILGQEILRELDQRRAENLLSRLFNERGAPDEVLVPETAEWDRRAWKNFARDFQCEIRLVPAEGTKLPPLLQLAVLVKDQVVDKLLEACRRAMRKARNTEIAAGLVRSASQLRSREKRAAVLTKAVHIDPKCAAAELELGELAMQRGALKEAFQHYSRVITLEAPRWDGFDVNWWTDLETRPYLRALFGRMLVHWHNGKFHEAIASAEQVLRLNRKDNQGVRFLLPMLYQLAEQPDHAYEFFLQYEQHYPNDYVEPSFYFAWGLALSQREEETLAIEKYRKAMLRNIYIAPLLLDLPEPRTDIWHPTDRSEPGYAYEFFDSYVGLWERDTAVLRILREAYMQVQPELKQLIDVRARMADLQDQRYDPGHEARWKALLQEEREILGERQNESRDPD